MIKVEWLTTKQAAALIGYNAEYIRKLAQSGRIPAQKLGRDWLIQRADLLTHVRSVGQKGRKRGPKTAS
jgi:excisionase family DNA binding protein